MAIKDLYFSAKGRVNRKVYWIRYGFPAIALSLIAFLLDAIVGSNFGNGVGIFVVIVELCLLYPGIVMSIKRLHDRGRSGWFVLLCFVPVAFIWPAVEIAFLKGNAGSNKFGVDPIESKS